MSAAPMGTLGTSAIAGSSDLLHARCQVAGALLCQTQALILSSTAAAMVHHTNKLSRTSRGRLGLHVYNSNSLPLDMCMSAVLGTYYGQNSIGQPHTWPYLARGIIKHARDVGCNMHMTIRTCAFFKRIVIAAFNSHWCSLQLYLICLICSSNLSLEAAKPLRHSSRQTKSGTEEMCKSERPDYLVHDMNV